MVSRGESLRSLRGARAGLGVAVGFKAALGSGAGSQGFSSAGGVP